MWDYRLHNIAYVDYHILQKAGQMPTYFDDIVKLTSLGGIKLCCALASKLCRNAPPKPSCLATPTCFDFSSSNCNLHGHIVSTTTGGALSYHHTVIC